MTALIVVGYADVEEEDGDGLTACAVAEEAGQTRVLEVTKQPHPYPVHNLDLPVPLIEGDKACRATESDDPEGT